jgi:hypothetical protein
LSLLEKRSDIIIQKEDKEMSEDHFSSTLDSLIGFNVNLYVGEQVYKGKLIGVEADHVIIENENNYIFYYKINQIQAITKNTKQFQGEETTSEYLKTQSLREVLDTLTNSWVTIFCISKQKFTGILSKVSTDYITLINGADGILIQLANIANVIKGELKDEDNSESKEEENQADAKTEQLSYASPVMMVEENVALQETDEVAAVESEPKHEAVIKREPEQQKASWSQPIKNTVEKQSEMVPEMTADQEEQPKTSWSQPIKNTVEKQSEMVPEMTADKEEQPKTSWSQPVKNKVEKQSEVVPKRTADKEEQPEELTFMDEVEYQAEPAIKIIKEEIKQPGKVWSQSIKNNNEKLNETVTKKKINELKKMREEQVQANKKQEIKKEKVVNTTKKEENKKAVKEVKVTQKQESSKTVNKAQEVSLDKKSEPKQTEQPIRTFRFLGEPIASRDHDRPSIFDGWFSRNKDSRF